MLTVHHLRRSQSERIVWLCEELEIPYTLRSYDRDPVTRLATPEYKRLHPIGAAPVIDDDGRVLAESGAIVDYVVAKFGAGHLTLAVDHPDFATYLYWLHFANGNLQPNVGRNMILGRLALPADDPTLVATRGRLRLALEFMDRHLAGSIWLAGAEFTIADVMTVFSLTTMRLFHPFDLGPYAQIRAYLQRIGERPAYRAAMAKGDPGMKPMLE